MVARGRRVLAEGLVGAVVVVFLAEGVEATLLAGEVAGWRAGVAQMKQSGVHFRNDIVVGPGGKQILAEDLDGNPVELFES